MYVSQLTMTVFINAQEVVNCLTVDYDSFINALIAYRV